MFCRKCGAQVEEKAKFCPKCGCELRKNQQNKTKVEKRTGKKKKKSILFIGVLLSIILVAGLYLKICVFTPSDGTQKLKLSQDKNSSISEVEVDYVLKGMGGKVQITELNNEKELINSVAGIQGTPIDISVKNRKVKSANIKFLYDDSKVDVEQAKKFKIAYYNEKLGRMELLEDSKVDTSSKTVSVKTTHFSKYVVVDSDEWYDAWAESQLLIRDESLAQNYFDIVFTLDCSGSMEGNDKNGLSKTCAYDFIKELYDGDYFTVLKFSDNAESVLEKQRVEDVISWDNVSERVQSISAGGGTNIEGALKASLSYALDKKERTVPIVVLLSDGQASVSEEVLTEVVNSKIKVVTIGFGEDADEELLMKIANSTGGQYYKAGESDISLIFERIREEYIGIDLKSDSDNDGIPDKIETEGMRNQYGNIIHTDPDNPDTDGDGISDGVEMGEVVVNEEVSVLAKEMGVNKYAYFEMATDPTVYDENMQYNPKVLFDIKAEIKDKEKKVIVNLETSNGAKVSTTDKGGKNVINDIKQAKGKFTIPDCLKTENTEIDFGSIRSGDVQKTEVTFSHDSTKCNGEKHVILAEITGKNIKSVTKEVRINGIYWYEKLSEENYNMQRMDLIEKVRAYSSTYDKTKIEYVLSNKDLTQEEIASFWEKQREDLNLRYRLNYLCNDDIYVAHGFRIYLENKNFIEKGMLAASKMTFNDGIINTVVGQPEKNRYKQMLLDYMDSTMEQRQEQNQINELMNGYNQIISSYGKLAGDLEKQQAVLQVECKTAVDTINKNLEYLNGSDKSVTGINERMKILKEQQKILKENGVNVNVANQIDSDVLKGLEEEKNRLSGIGNVANSVGFVFSVTTDAIQMFDNITKITSGAQTYADYEQFLGLIASKTKYPELKAAATELQNEIRDKYKLYANESWNFMMKTGINTLETLSGVGLYSFCGAASNFFSEAGLVGIVGKMVLNKSLGIDDLLEDSVYVVGASEVADILSQKMIESREKFNEKYFKSYDEAYEAAEQFRYYYIELQQMRLYGEKKYLDMKGMSGAMDIFGNAIKEWTQYEEAQKICDDTIKEVENMKF